MVWQPGTGHSRNSHYPKAEETKKEIVQPGLRPSNAGRVWNPLTCAFIPLPHPPTFAPPSSGQSTVSIGCIKWLLQEPRELGVCLSACLDKLGQVSQRDRPTCSTEHSPGIPCSSLSNNRSHTSGYNLLRMIIYLMFLSRSSIIPSALKTLGSMRTGV